MISHNDIYFLINLLDLITDIENKFSSTSIDKKKNIIEFADEVFVTILQDCCKEVLGEIDENKKISQSKNYKDFFNCSNNFFYSFHVGLFHFSNIYFIGIF